ncbi:MAG TPA: D-alanyl-D-alanine carboxypeptidase/D-alanyl-D-alanine-endopeptidase [Longimicrobium sp.]|nr:D-alanyl-D-alanine carboxypeptidase/D-alanyl-D-alanine-endopeptidase [Longimicrobium sp.]
MPIRRRLALAAAAALAACTPAPARTPPIAPAPVPQAAPAAPSPERRLAESLDSIFNDTLFAGANWGVEIRAQQTGRVLYERNAGKMFVPASNMKLVTGSVALEALGPDFVYRTPVVATGPVTNGVLHGDLVVVGSGDPTIAADFRGGDALAVFRAWADSLRAHGVRRITGRIIGNDDVFDDVPYGRGWAWDDMADYYSAEIGGLQYNLGVVGITAAAGPTAGAPARITLDPQTGYVRVVNASRTVPGAVEQIEVTRADTGNTFTVAGQIPADTPAVRNDMAVRNNTAYFVTVLRETLLASGIRVDGAALDQDELASAVRPVARDTLWVQTSPPLREILPGFFKPSQNQVGEILLKTLGRALRNEGSARAGIAVVDSVTRLWGLPPRKLSQADGSGLSRYNLVAPQFLIGVLEHMRRSPNYQTFYAALPVAGVDGTLRSRMKGTPLEGNVHAKTGTVSNVRSLSGYMTTAAGEPIVFSILVNHHTLTSRDADRLAEMALMRVYGLTPRR